MDISTFSHLWTTDLQHAGSCSFLGISPDERLYVEEFYEDTWFAQHQLAGDGSLVASVDEEYGETPAEPFSLPPGSYVPATPPADHPLNLPLLREWGMRETDRIMEWVQPLSIAEKMAVIAGLSLGIPPMLLPGLAESRVLAQAPLDERWSLVCRRLRLAVALPEVRRHPSGAAYDYETVPYYVAQVWDHQAEEASSLENTVRSIDGIALVRPLDCITHGNYLFIAEGGSSTLPSRIHCWNMANAR